ncbi:MAG: hypothetical protein AB7O96_00815 [Pseudobdellovibrionaceae bacterium]
MEVVLKFKFEYLENEFLQVDPRLQAIALFTAFSMRILFGYQAVATCVKRSHASQASLKAEGKTNVETSPHEDWRAIDFRLKDFPDKAHVNVLVDLINNTFPRNDGFKVAIAHGEGDNFHLHLQVPKVRRF